MLCRPLEFRNRAFHMLFFLMYTNWPGSISLMSWDSKIGAFSFLLLALFLTDTLMPVALINSGWHCYILCLWVHSSLPPVFFSRLSLGFLLNRINMLHFSFKIYKLPYNSHQVFPSYFVLPTMQSLPSNLKLTKTPGVAIYLEILTIAWFSSVNILNPSWVSNTRVRYCGKSRKLTDTVPANSTEEAV